MDKTQLIKEEIERLKSINGFLPIDNHELCDAYKARGYQLACEDILQFIDSLPEEHNEDLEEAANKYGKEETILPESYNDGDIPDYEKWTADAFKVGAQWQKQQMMKYAVEGIVKYEIGSAVIPQCDRRYQVLSNPTPITNAKLGDKVKIIILKTEQL